MRTYEALYIVTPEAEDDSIQTTAKEVESLVTDNGGSVVRSEIWGKRKLAYEVNKHSEGNYILLRFNAEQDVIPRLESYFKLSEAVLRHLLLHLDAHTLRLEAEQERRKEAELARSAEKEAREGPPRDDGHSPRRYGDDDRPPRQRDDDRPPRQRGDDRPPRQRDGEDRPPRQRDGEDRPPRQRDGEDHTPRHREPVAAAAKDEE